MRYSLDPLSPTGISKEAEKPSYRPYFAGGPGKPSLLDSVNGKHGAVQITAGTNVTIDNTGKDTIQISASGGGSISDAAYSSDWNGDTTNAPSKNTIYDKIEAIEASDGDVIGPASSTDNAIARFDGATGKLIQNSPVTLGDAGDFIAADNVNLGFYAGNKAAGTGTNLSIYAGYTDDTTANGGDVNIVGGDNGDTTQRGYVKLSSGNAAGEYTKIDNSANTTTRTVTLPNADISLGGFPASSTDNAIARFDGTTGKLVQNSTVTINDAGGVSTTIADTGNAIGLSITQNDVTNNPISFRIIDNGAGDSMFVDKNNTGNGLEWDQDVTNKNNPSTSVSIENTSVVNDGATYTKTGTIFVVGNSVTETSGTITNSQRVALLRNTDTDATGDILELDQDGTGRALFANMDNNGIAIFADKDVTNKNNTANAVTIDHTSVVNDAGTYTKTGAALQITSNVTETSGTITDSHIVVDINQTHADATGNVLDIDNDGTGSALFVQQDGVNGTNKRSLFFNQNSDLSASGAHGVLIYSNIAHTVASATAASLLRVENDNASAVNVAAVIKQDGTGRALSIVTTGTGLSLDIDQDASSASSITAAKIDVDNASTGGAIGLDISGVTATSGTVIGQRIALPSGGTANYALQLSDTTGVAAGGITAGTDTNLYRVAANVWASDDSARLAGYLRVGSVSAPNNTTAGDLTFVRGFGTSINIDNALADDTVSGIQTTFTAGETLAFGDACYIKSDGKLWKADADAIATAGAIAIATAAISADATGTFLLQGIIRDDSAYAFTVGGLIYLSTTAGGITQTAPSGTDDVVQVLGVAINADKWFFRPELVQVEVV